MAAPRGGVPRPAHHPADALAGDQRRATRGAQPVAPPAQPGLAADAAPTQLPGALLLRLAADEPVPASGPGEEAGVALARLVALGLLEPLPDETYRLHRLVAAFARDSAPDLVAAAAAVTQSLMAA